MTLGVVKLNKGLDRRTIYNRGLRIGSESLLLYKSIPI